jgi:hypothetical protein
MGDPSHRTCWSASFAQRPMNKVSGHGFSPTFLKVCKEMFMLIHVD